MSVRIICSQAAAALLLSFFAGNNLAMASETATDVICNGCVNTGDLADQSISTSKLKVGALGSSRIKNGAVINSKLGGGAVTESKLSNAVRDKLNAATTNGIEFAAADNGIAINDTASTPTNVMSIDVTVPGAGYIEVNFSSYLFFNHATGSNSIVTCAIKTDVSSPNDSTNRLVGSRRLLVVPGALPNAQYYPHTDQSGVLTVSTAGTYTLNALCFRNSNSAAATARERTLTATYHSERY